MTCAHVKSHVFDSRRDPSGVISRRRECVACKHRWATVEMPADQWQSLRQAAGRQDTVVASIMRALAEHGYVDLDLPRD